MSIGIRPRGGQTHTCVTMPVSPQVYLEIRNKLVAAGYDHVFDGDAMDMTGIALVPDEGVGLAVGGDGLGQTA